MNEHIELLVAVKPRKAYMIAKIALYVVTVLLALGVLGGLLGLLPLVVAILAGVAAYFIRLRVDIEYEYTLTEKEIDIDVIYSKQSRKNVTSLDLTKLEIMAPMNSAKLDGYKNRPGKYEDYSSKDMDKKKDMYVMYYDGSRKIIIEPDETLYKAIYNVAPHKVYNN